MLALRRTPPEAFGIPDAAALAVGAVREVARGSALFNSFVYIFIFIGGTTCYSTRYYSTTFLSSCCRQVDAVDAPPPLPGLPALFDADALNPPRKYEPLDRDLRLPFAHIARHGKGLVADGAVLLPEAAGEPVEPEKDELVVRVKGRQHAVKDAVRNAGKGVRCYGRTCYSRWFYSGTVRRFRVEWCHSGRLCYSIGYYSRWCYSRLFHSSRRGFASEEPVKDIDARADLVTVDRFVG